MCRLLQTGYVAFVDYGIAARVQVLLEGVPLPAGRERLVRYARQQDARPDDLAALQRVPDREYAALDEVGEAMVRVQPSWEKPEAREPQEESDAVPGGMRDYVTARPQDTGRVRDPESARG